VSISGDTRFIIENGGYVGIGTTDPGYLLDIYESSTSAIGRIKSDFGYAGLFIDRTFPAATAI